MNIIEYIRSALVGTPKGRAAYREALRSNPTIRSGLASLHSVCDESDDATESPIFLLSAGWRSGSTLLQRLIMSDPDVLVWGEPYDECGIIQAMAEPLKAFRPGWPPDDYLYKAGTRPQELTSAWVANLFPDMNVLRAGYRAFFDTTFGSPAREAGARRWGIKEVRLDASHALFLQWLYPNAKFILLYRNPLAAYRSYCRYGRDWYDVYPDKPVLTPWAFGRHWRRLMEDFTANAETLGAMMLSYEELIGASPELLRRMEDHLAVQLDPGILQKKVGTSERAGEKPWVSRLESIILRRAVGPVAWSLGYDV